MRGPCPELFSHPLMNSYSCGDRELAGVSDVKGGLPGTRRIPDLPFNAIMKKCDAWSFYKPFCDARRVY
jgi:hypothetical protein